MIGSVPICHPTLNRPDNPSTYRLIITSFCAYTLKPILSLAFSTERLPAGAGRISDMLFQVLKYDVFRDGTVGG